MDVDQVFKRVQWMEDERRKDKDTIAMLESRIVSLEGNLAAANHNLKDLMGEITRLSTLVTRMDHFDEILIQVRAEAKHQVEDLDKETKKREEEAEKVRRVEIKALDTNIFEVRRGLEPIARLEKGLAVRAEEDTRLSRLIDELRARIETVKRSEEDYNRTYRLLEDGRRQDSKRLTDLAGEVAALRKRSDEQRGQSELANTGLRKLETRLSELLVVETERRDAQSAFLDRQALLSVERDRVWKEWQARFDTIEKQTVDVETQLQKLDATHREAKRLQQTIEEITQRVDRRVSEITEIQRLTEERFRQEWVTFKADDQKRWTNYTLTQEEQRGESTRQYDKLLERLTHLEDELQEEQDLLEQVNEQAEKRLQSLLALAHEWVSENERVVGRSR